MSSGRVVRPVFAVFLAALWALVCTYAIAFVGVAAPQLGFLWAGLVYALGLVAAAFVWGGPRRSIVLAMSGVVALGLGLTAWYVLPPSHDRLERVADGIDLPAGMTLAESDNSGNSWCLEGCPEVRRTYELPTGTTYVEARDELVAEFDDEGWDSTRSFAEDGRSLTHGRWQVDIFENDEGLLVATFSG